MRKITLVLLLYSCLGYAQKIEDHQWRNRVLLVYSSDRNSTEAKKQLSILKENSIGIKDRKLIIYRFTKEHYTINFKKSWQKSNYLFKKYVNNLKEFQVLLIGLDGGIKLKQQTVLNTVSLFKLIDGMPMRKRALKNK